MQVAIGVVVVLAVLAVIILFSAIKILREYERGVIFRLGRLVALKGPGLILLIPIIDPWCGSTCGRSPSTSRRRR